MAQRMDQIVVIDVESTCWSAQPPAGQTSEIIEIGVCTLDIASGNRLQRRDILVRPERSSVSTFCTQLTTLTQDRVEEGILFADACSVLKEKYLTRERVWASYGDYDRTMFSSQCEALGIDYPFGKRHINIKTLFALIHALPHEIGMDAALEMLGLPLEGTHHRADDDAWNTARLLSKLLLQKRQ